MVSGKNRQLWGCWRLFSENAKSNAKPGELQEFKCVQGREAGKKKIQGELEMRSVPLGAQEGFLERERQSESGNSPLSKTPQRGQARSKEGCWVWQLGDPDVFGKHGFGEQEARWSWEAGNEER